MSTKTKHVPTQPISYVSEPDWLNMSTRNDDTGRESVSVVHTSIDKLRAKLSFESDKTVVGWEDSLKEMIKSVACEKFDSYIFSSLYMKYDKEYYELYMTGLSGIEQRMELIIYAMSNSCRQEFSNPKFALGGNKFYCLDPSYIKQTVDDCTEEQYVQLLTILMKKCMTEIYSSFSIRLGLASVTALYQSSHADAFFRICDVNNGFMNFIIKTATISETELAKSVKYNTGLLGKIEIPVHVYLYFEIGREDIRNMTYLYNGLSLWHIMILTDQYDKFDKTFTSACANTVDNYGNTPLMLSLINNKWNFAYRILSTNDGSLTTSNQHWSTPHLLLKAYLNKPTQEFSFSSTKNSEQGVYKAYEQSSSGFMSIRQGCKLNEFYIFQDKKSEMTSSVPLDPVVFLTAFANSVKSDKFEFDMELLKTFVTCDMTDIELFKSVVGHQNVRSHKVQLREIDDLIKTTQVGLNIGTSTDPYKLYPKYTNMTQMSEYIAQSTQSSYLFF